MNIKSTRETLLLNPSQNNPRNSEGSFVALDDGRIAFAYSHFYGNNGADDGAPCDIYVIFSNDGGESFDIDNPTVLVRASEYGIENIMSVSLLRMQNGDIGVFYLVKRYGFITEYILRRYDGNLSEKLNETLCAPCGISGYYVINNDRVLRTSDGRLLVAASKHPCSALPDMPEALGGHGTVVFFTSNDDGYTWEMLSQQLDMDSPYSWAGFQEPGLAQLANGSLYCYMRTDRMYQYESFSMDGRLWTAPQASNFTSPCSPMLIKRNPYSGKYYAIWNPIPEYPMRPQTAAWTAGRTPYVIADSSDGVYFSAPIVIEDDPTRGYCYPAIHFLSADKMLIAYCSGGEEDGGCCLNRITIRMIELA